MLDESNNYNGPNSFFKKIKYFYWNQPVQTVGIGLIPMRWVLK